MAFSRILVANRGEIAVRIIDACHSMGLEAVLVVSEADRDGLPARLADRAICIGPPHSSDSYLNAAAIVATAVAVQADAVHPGYGYLAESASFAELCEENGLVFVGPSPQVMRLMADKVSAKDLASSAGIPVAPGGKSLTSPAQATSAAEEIGFPLILKAVWGGGGRGMRIVREPDELPDAFRISAAEAGAAFGQAELYAERYVASARHVEVQVVADGQGEVVHLGDRDCTIQRRHQKVIEEAPAALVSIAARHRMTEDAVTLSREVGYVNAGTVEFLVDMATEEYYFLEMNTRIQVEHPVTEMITGADLVAAQIRIAEGRPLPWLQSDIVFSGHSIECRITAESPTDFAPSPGPIHCWSPPTFGGVRVDSHCYSGYVVPPFYDSLLAKLVTWGTDRSSAMQVAQQALAEFQIIGPQTNIPLLSEVLAHQDVAMGQVDTTWLERHVKAESSGT